MHRIRRTAQVNARRLIFCLAAAIWSQAAPNVHADGSAPKLFVGEVLETHPKENWFVMRGGASKKYARITVRYDSKTQWSGLDAAKKAAKAGDHVRVNSVPLKDGAYRAVALFKINPNEKPASANGGMSKPH